MGNDSLPDKNIVEHPLAEQYAPLLCILGPGAPAKIVSINDLAILYVGPFTLRNLLANEIMESGYADPGLPLVMVVVVIADVRKKFPS